MSGVAPLSRNPLLREVLRHAEALLREAGVDTPELDARLLMGAALGMTREHMLIHATAKLNQAQVTRVLGFIARRVEREPVSRILGRREFWSLDFHLSPATLDPRPDSETVIDEALAGIPEKQAPLSVLDLGTGTGCLLLALLSELPNASGIGVDKSEEAVVDRDGQCPPPRLGPARPLHCRRLGHGADGTLRSCDFKPALYPRRGDRDPGAGGRPIRPGGGACRRSRRAGCLSRDHSAASQPVEIKRARSSSRSVPGKSGDVAALLGGAGFSNIGTRRDLAGVERAVFGHLSG